MFSIFFSFLNDNLTWAKRLRAKQWWPELEKKGSQCSAQHQAAWKLPWTNTNGNVEPETPLPGSGLWTMASIRNPDGNRWKIRDCPSFSSYAAVTARPILVLLEDNSGKWDWIGNGTARRRRAAIDGAWPPDSRVH